MNVARKPLIAGNWKMNHGGAKGLELAMQIAMQSLTTQSVDLVIAPPFTILAAIAQTFEELVEQQKASCIGLAAQNIHPGEAGAFTGEISGSMLREAGCEWVLIGHSERRYLFGESDEFFAKKAFAALNAGLKPIVCVGETLQERIGGRTLAVVLQQLAALIPALEHAEHSAVIAYEPVWAIGTGHVATPHDAQEVHAAIRSEMRTHNTMLADKTRILYGGSVTPHNAESLLAQPEVDGLLVGGASLVAESFLSIVREAQKLRGSLPSKPS